MFLEISAILSLLLPLILGGGTVSRKSPHWEIVGSRYDVNGVSVEGYLGIPYAQPPVGPLRYRKPEALHKFPAYLEAFTFANSCQQTRLEGKDYISEDNDVSRNVPMDEDCLYLNIWTPSSSDNHLKSVMFWIPGGAYIFGSGGYMYDGSMLSSLGDVVVVTINYRLGSFGFLVSGTEEAPGNMGLYDQLMALQWVHDNIKYFGGDPEKVTIFGESAGGISVGCMLTSKKAENLFKRAILQSGTPNVPHIFNARKEVLKFTDQFSKILGCNSEGITIFTNPKSVLECFHEKSAQELRNAEDLCSRKAKTRVQFVPILDEEFIGWDEKTLFNPSYYSNHEMIIGVNKVDMASLFLRLFPKLLKNGLSKLSLEQTVEITETLLRNSLMIEDAHELIDHYFKYVPSDNVTAINGRMFDIFSDFMFICPSVFFANELSSRGSDVFFYYYTYPTSTVYFFTSDSLRAFQFDAVTYIFGLPLALKHYNYTENQFSKDLIQLWTTFAKNGNPSPGKWMQYTSDQPRAYELHAGGNRMLPNIPQDQRCRQVWGSHFGF